VLAGGLDAGTMPATATSTGRPTDAYKVAVAGLGSARESVRGQPGPSSDGWRTQGAARFPALVRAYAGTVCRPRTRGPRGRRD
jgi:hypothetical protein